jgi:predicted nucleic acid-binding protein
MIILDTQVISKLQRGDSRDAVKLAGKLSGIRDQDVRITVISPYEQLADCIGQLKLDRKKPENDLAYFVLLQRLLEHYASWRGRILSFDQAALTIFQRSPSKMVQKIKSRDSRIAAIVLANQGTLLSANLRDF